jgi:formylglycine-generating enzyme required for sulfatase activity
MFRRWWLIAGLVAVLTGYLAYERFGVAGLNVSSDPAGALVRVNGRAAGITPLRGVRLSPGMYRVELQHSHYQIYERRLALAAGPATELHARLELGEGTLVVHSNPRGAWIEVDGQQRRGVTPQTIVLPSGEHQVVVGMQERRSMAQRVLVTAGERQEIRIDMDMDPHGSLQIDTGPGARVSLPDSAVPYRPGVRLPVGEYRVRIEQPGFETQDVRFQVRYGDNRYRVDLARAYGLLTVSGLPADARARVDYREVADGPLIRKPYAPAMRVPVGEVEIRASAMGHRSEYRRLRVEASGARLALTLAPMQAVAGARLRDRLQDGSEGPALVVIPPGAFLMGTPGGLPSEQPARRVFLTEPFAFAVFEVRVDEYRRFALATGRALDDRLGGVEGDRPVTQVSFADATAYADWLTGQTGRRYRLPSEAEWEYVARAGSTGAYDFGDDPGDLCRHANVADRSMARRPAGSPAVACDDGFPQLAPVGSFPANRFGVHDMLGNVAEWVQDCGMPPYAGAPDDGAPIEQGADCVTRGVRGGSWETGAEEVRSAKRAGAASAGPTRGIRLLREL